MPRYSCKVELKPVNWDLPANNVVQAEMLVEKGLFEDLMASDHYRKILKDSGKLIIDCKKYHD